MRVSRKTKVALLVLAVIALLLARSLGSPLFRMLLGRSGVQVTISKDTTRLVEPLREDGYVDYVAALNAQFSQGVTPDNNAVVLLLHAIGPGKIEETDRDRYFKLLGIPPLPENGDYYTPLDRYAEGLKGPGTSVRLHNFAQVQAQLARVIEKPLKELSKAVVSNYPKQVAKVASQLAGDAGFALYKQQEQARRRPWSKQKFPRLADWLAANEKPFALVVQSSQRPRRFDPVVCDDGSMSWALIPGMGAYRELARALTTRAMLRAGAGDVDGAWSDLLACHRLARLVGQGPSLLDRLTAFGVDAFAWDADQGLLQHVQLTAAQAKRMRGDLARLPPMTAMADIADVCERYCFLDGVGVAARDGIERLAGTDTDDAHRNKSRLKSLADSWHRAEVDWDVVLRMGNPWIDRAVDAYRKPTRAERQAAIKQILADWNAVEAEAEGWKAVAISYFGDRRSAVSQQVGRMFVAGILPAVLAGARFEDRADMTADLGQLAFDLAAYRADHGHYPARLADLAPAYLAEIPKDIFNNYADLHYRRQGDGYLLYSVGVNGKDDGGRGPDDHDSRDVNGWPDDIVVRVP